MPNVRQNDDLKRLNDLIAGLGSSSDAGNRSQSPYKLLLEHLQSARRDLLGSMRGEYLSNLQFAQDSLSCIPDKLLRAETKKTLQGLLSPLAA
jgi:hypothetical protein